MQEKRFFTGKPCKHGHVVERFTINKRCVTCAYESQSRIGKILRSSGPKVTAGKSRATAIAKGESTYFTGKPCKYGHVAARFTASYTCVECQPNLRAAYLSKKPAAPRLWKQNNKGRVLSDTRKRQLSKRKRTPRWADWERIETLYSEAARMSRELGVPMHVDHVIPLQGKYVSGLHVHENLSIIPARENLRKSRRFEGIGG